MFSMVKGPATLTRQIRKLRGGSQPILAEASDGLLYVVKFLDNPQGPNLAFNESAGAELYRAFNLPVPSWRPLLVTNSFIERNPACWAETPVGLHRPAAGLCIGSRFLGGEGVHLLEILPSSSFNQVRNLKDFWLAWLVDICVRHTDNRQAVFQEGLDGHLNAVFIDNGHMFGGPDGSERRHFRASAYLDSRIYQDVPIQFLVHLRRIVANLDASILWRKIISLPDEWKKDSAIQNFAQSVETLQNAKIVQRVLDTIVDSLRQTKGHEEIVLHPPKKCAMSVLCSGV